MGALLGPEQLFAELILTRRFSRTITLAVNFGTTLFLAGCINVFETEPGVGIFEGKPYQIYLIFFGITLLCNAVSALGNKWLPWLDVSSIFRHPFSYKSGCPENMSCCIVLCCVVFIDRLTQGEHFRHSLFSGHSQG